MGLACPRYDEDTERLLLLLLSALALVLAAAVSLLLAATVSAARSAVAAREQVFHPALPAPAFHTSMEEIQREYEAIPEEYLDTSTRLPGLVRQSTLGELLTSLANNV